MDIMTSERSLDRSSCLRNLSWYPACRHTHRYFRMTVWQTGGLLKERGRGRKRSRRSYSYPCAPRPTEAAKHAWRKPKYTDRQSVSNERGAWAVSGLEQHFESSIFSVRDAMSALLDGLLGSIAASPAEVSGSFQSGFGVDYDYGGGAADRSDHYGGHSGHHHHSGSYHDDKCCPLVVDALCLAAILGAIAGAAVLLGRVFIVELCNVNGANVRNPCVTGRRRRKREIEVPFWSSAGFYWRAQLAIEGKLIYFSLTRYI